jgi:hypothetical protein
MSYGHPAGHPWAGCPLPKRPPATRLPGRGESHAAADAGLGAILGLLVALLTPMVALAQADTTTTHFSDTASSPDVNPCTGVPGTITDSVKGVIHVTALSGGGFHETTTVTDNFRFVPDDPSQPTYTGKSTFWAGSNVSSRNNFTLTVTASFHVRAPTAPGLPVTPWPTSPCTPTAPSPSSSRRTGCP